MKHCISIPYHIPKEYQLIVHKKRLGYTVLIHKAYKLNIKHDLSQNEIVKQLKDIALKYGIDSYTTICAVIDGISIAQKDREFHKKYLDRKENIDKLNQRNSVKKQELKDKLLTVKTLKEKRKILLQLKSLHPRHIKEYKIGHIVFGGKKNLLAHQKRIDKLNNALVNATDESEISKIEKLIDKSKKDWKNSRLKPLNIIGETRKEGNRLFKINKNLTKCELVFNHKPSGTRFGPSIEEKVILKLGKLNGKWHDLLGGLQVLAERGEITLLFRLNDKTLDVVYDPLDLRKIPKNHTLKSVNELVIQKGKKGRKPKNGYISNPLKDLEFYKDSYIHPEYKETNKVYSNRSIGIDLNPEYIGVSVTEFVNNPEYSINDIRQIQVLDYKLFKLDIPCSNSGNEYNKKYMLEVLSNISGEVMGLAIKYRISSLFMEDGLGRLVGKTKSKKLNGLLNHWSRESFTSILERKCYLLRNMNNKYCQAIKIYKVWPGYSSVIGNVAIFRTKLPVKWNIKVRFRKPPDNKFFIPSKLPDAVGSATEISRRGIVSVISGNRDYKGKISTILPEYLSDLLLDQWKDLEVDEESWVGLYTEIKILIQSKDNPEIVGYRNSLEDCKILMSDACVKKHRYRVWNISSGNIHKYSHHQGLSTLYAG